MPSGACKGEQRRVEGLALAHRAPARPGQAFAFFEDEPALGTLRRLDNEALAGPVKGLPDMLKVAGNLLLGDAHQAGEVPGRERPHLQLHHDQVTDGIMRLGGRTGPFTMFIVLSDHENSILPLSISGSARPEPEDDRNISIGRLDKHQHSATICVRIIPNQCCPAAPCIITPRKRGS